MGTSYRSALSWNIDTTAVELVPSVTKAFGFYHADAARFLNDPNGHIVIDDGRRFLKRTAKKYDIIVVDPPPPVEAAGSSLLYSKEFYELAKQHLKPGGILQMWFPGGEDLLSARRSSGQSTNRSLMSAAFTSVAGWGGHILASSRTHRTTRCKSARGADARKLQRMDLLEWDALRECPGLLSGGLLITNISVPELLNPNPEVQITDDQPYNEYFLLRRLGLS